MEPLWSRFVRRAELVTGLYEAAAVPALLYMLTGTPMLAPVLRLFGAHIGRRTWIGTTYLTEFDLVEIGDDGKELYWLDSQGRDRAAVVAQDLASGKFRVLAEDAQADFGEPVLDPVSCAPIARWISAAATEESTPPDRPRMTSSPPTCCFIFSTASET